MQTSMINSTAARFAPAKPFTTSRAPARVVAARAQSQDAAPKQQASEFLMRSVGALAAVQLAFLPCGAALATEPAVESATKVAEEVQGAVPEGAANPKTREERNSSRDEGLASKLDTIKDRFNADKIIEGANTGDIFFGDKSEKPVSFSSLSAPSLQINAAFDPAGQVGDALKSAQSKIGGSNSPVDAVKDKASDIKGNVEEAKSGLDTKPVSFSRSSLQVNVSEAVQEAASDAARDAGSKLKAAAPSDPLSAFKGLAADATSAAKKAGNNLPGQGIDTKPVAFWGANLQRNVGLNPIESTKEAARDAATSVKAETGGNPFEALRNKIDQASITSDSPQKQLDQAADKVSGLKQGIDTKPVSLFRPFSTAGHTLFLADIGNASLAGPEGNAGGVTQRGGEEFTKNEGNPLKGGDLKDSFGNEDALQENPSVAGKTASASDAVPRSSETGNSGLPSMLFGSSLVRPDSETPEKVATENIAKARASQGNAIDSLKEGLDLQ